jgi:hypothetical protein
LPNPEEVGLHPHIQPQGFESLVPAQDVPCPATDLSTQDDIEDMSDQSPETGEKYHILPMPDANTYTKVEDGKYFCVFKPSKPGERQCETPHKAF